MPNLPVEFIRGVLGLLCLFFGYMGGRAAAAFAKGRVPGRRLFTWIARMVLCSAGLIIRSPIDTIAIAVWVAEIAVFALGYWMLQNEKPPEDLTHEIFPE
jgi:hypothetical protein